MKNILLSILVFILLSFGSSKLNAQLYCNQNGYNLVTKQYTFNGCAYEVNLCVKCAPGGLAEFATIMSFKKLNPNCTPNPSLSPAQILSLIEQQVNTYAFLLETCNGVPPCEEGVASFYLRTPICWSIFRESTNEFRYTICMDDNSGCDQIWEYCWDSQTGLRRYEIATSPSYSGPTDGQTCTDSESVAVPNQNDILIGTYSNCFYLPTRCTWP